MLTVEPSSREFRCLQANIALNRLDNVEPIRVALHSDTGSAQLVRAERGHERQNTIGDRIPNPGVAPAGSETVRLETLDALATSRRIGRLDLVKLDAEGCESRIVEGGRETLRRLTPILLIEVAPDHLASQGSTVDGLLDLLGELEYELAVFGSDGRPRARAADEPLTSNIIAIPQASCRRSL